jgi:hypothetical protein
MVPGAFQEVRNPSNAGEFMRDITRRGLRDTLLVTPTTQDESDRMLYRRGERGKAGACHAYLGAGEVE